MLSDTFPSGTILFEFLFLSIAIAIEALIFQARLNFGPRTSVAYAASINLFSTVIGWLVFFCIEPLLSTQMRIGLFNYVFFGRFAPLYKDMQSLLLIICVSIFFANFVFKIVGLQLLDYALKSPKTDESKRGITQQRRLGSSHTRENRERSGATAVLLANACSYSAILLILFVCSNKDYFLD